LSISKGSIIDNPNIPILAISAMGVREKECGLIYCPLITGRPKSL
jgi:hypothetical protein